MTDKNQNMLLRTHVAALIVDVTEMPVDGFLALLNERAAAAMRWVQASIEACGGEGAAAYYSRIHHPLRGWAGAYPQATGLLIPTLIEYGSFANRDDLLSLAAGQTRWLLSLQSLDGSFPGGSMWRGHKGDPSVFATGQVVLGLIAAADKTRDKDFLQGAAGAVRWLCDEFNETTGTWSGVEFQSANHACVCWAMLETWRRTQEARVREKAVRALDRIARGLENGAIDDWGSEPERAAFTESIAKSIRGLRECGRVLGKDGGRYSRMAERAATTLHEQLQENGRLAGAYNTQLEADQRFVCVPGNCQLAGIWLKMAEAGGNVEYFRSALRAVWQIIGTQRMRGRGTATRGALPGSAPIWGRYFPFRYPVEAGIAFVEALVNMHRLIERCPSELSEPGTMDAARSI